MTNASGNLKTDLGSEVPSKGKESGLEFGFITILAAIMNMLNITWI